MTPSTNGYIERKMDWCSILYIYAQIRVWNMVPEWWWPNGTNMHNAIRWRQRHGLSRRIWNKPIRQSIDTGIAFLPTIHVSHELGHWRNMTKLKCINHRFNWIWITNERQTGKWKIIHFITILYISIYIEWLIFK